MLLPIDEKNRIGKHDDAYSGGINMARNRNSRAVVDYNPDGGKTKKIGFHRDERFDQAILYIRAVDRDRRARS